MCLVLLIMHGVTHAEHLLKVLKLFSGNKNYRIGSQKNVAIDFLSKVLESTDSADLLLCKKFYPRYLM